MRWTQRIIPPGWLLLAVFATLALHHLLPIAQLWHAPLSWLGLLLVGAGLLFAAAGVGMFRRAGTSVIPFGRTTALVTTGVYRLTRNPMYLGLTLILSGTAWICGSLGAFLPLPLLVGILQGGFIRSEERWLEDLFGADYRTYKHRVPRWL
jgi:protein-S-isoprenylcysteine O-methyltransferase Ste14